MPTDDHGTDPGAGCLILGAGGHGRVVADALQASGRAGLAFLDSDQKLHGKTVLGVPVLGGDDVLGHARDRGFTHFALGLGSVRDNRPRRVLFAGALDAGLEPLTVIHPRAVVSAHVRFGRGVFLAAGAIVNPSARIGDNAIVNTGAIVEHDCTIGDHVHIAPGARLLGDVIIGDMAYIGAGAVIRQGVKVGDGVVVGAGAVVLRDLQPGTVAIGIPAADISH